MKLKMEEQDGVTVLTISENVSPPNIAVLRAGLSKLFASDRKTILLDLLALTEQDFTPTSTLKDLGVLIAWSQEQGAQLSIVSNIPGTGYLANRQEAISNLNSALARLLVVEAKLQAQLRVLEQQKSQLAEKVNSVSGGLDVKGIKRENGELKKRVAILESELRRLMTKRAEPADTDSARKKRKVVTDLLLTVLEGDGSVAVG